MKCLLNYVLVGFLSCGTHAAPRHPSQSDAVPIDREPRHRLALENEFVRVLDVRIPPGDTTLYHHHQRDSVYVAISGGKVATEEFGKPSNIASRKPGDVSYREHSKKPLIH